MSTFAIHRLNGIATPANAAYSSSELEFQLRSSGAKAVITCASLLDTALKAAKAVGIALDRIFIMQTGGSSSNGLSYKTIDELIDEGRSLAPLESPVWTKGQGTRQVAYLSYSSGTSGLPVCFPFHILWSQYGILAPKSSNIVGAGATIVIG